MGHPLGELLEIAKEGKSLNRAGPLGREMPELPEVEAARRALQEHCVGKRIVKCAAADDTKVIDGVAPDQLEASLVGRTITAARRKGKNLWLALDSPPHPTFQFGPSLPPSLPPNYFRWVSFAFLTALDRFLVLQVFILFYFLFED